MEDYNEFDEIDALHCQEEDDFAEYGSSFGMDNVDVDYEEWLDCLEAARGLPNLDEMEAYYNG